MKVLLKTDVKKLGRKGEIVDVSDGYATSALIPSGKVEVATPEAIKQLASKEANKVATLKQKEITAHEDIAALKDATIVIIAKSSGSKLFGAITAAELAQAIKKQYNREVKEKNISFDGHIKEIGTKEILVDTGFGAVAKMFVEVKSL